MTKLKLPLPPELKKKLLALTGILSLYSNPLKNREVTIEYKIREFSNDNIVSVKISCRELEVLYVTIDLKKKTIENSLVINRLSEDGTPVRRRAAFECFLNQVKIAEKEGFKYIEVNAWRVDDNGFEFDEKFYTLIGYKEFGRYGFMMPDKDERDHFCNVIKDNTNFSPKYISDIYTDSQITAVCQPVWTKLGKSWKGKFTLDKGSFGQIFLDDNYSAKQ